MAAQVGAHSFRASSGAACCVGGGAAAAACSGVAAERGAGCCLAWGLQLLMRRARGREAGREPQALRWEAVQPEEGCSGILGATCEMPVACTGVQESDSAAARTWRRALAPLPPLPTLLGSRHGAPAAGPAQGHLMYAAA